MRNRATDGTKISTSLSITKNTVRTSRRADRLFSSTIALASAKLRQQPDEPARARREQSGSIKASRGPLPRFAACGIGHDQVGQRANLEPLGNRQGPRQDQIARSGPQDRGTYNKTILPCHDLDETSGLPLGLCAVVLGKAPAQHTRSGSVVACCSFTEPNMGEFRVGVGDPRQRAIIYAGWQSEQRVPDHNSGVIKRNVRELRPA